MFNVRPPLRGRLLAPLSALLFALLLSSCASYRSNLMLQPLNADGDFDKSQVVDQLPAPPAVHQVHAGDLLRFRVFTNGGETILDPNGELGFGAPAGLGGIGRTGGATRAAQANAAGASGGSLNSPADNTSTFEVQPDGRVRLPMVGFVTVKGLELLQIDSMLEEKFSTFYKDVFVESRIANRRVIVLGAVGSTMTSQVVPLTTETTSLLEVLAQAGGIAINGRAKNVRLIRGADARTAQVQLIDLSTIEGMRKANAQVVANDVVYIEPVRRPAIEAITDIARFVGIISGLAFAATLLLRL